MTPATLPEGYDDPPRSLGASGTPVVNSNGYNYWFAYPRGPPPVDHVPFRHPGRGRTRQTASSLLNEMLGTGRSMQCRNPLRPRGSSRPAADHTASTLRSARPRRARAKPPLEDGTPTDDRVIRGVRSASLLFTGVVTVGSDGAGGVGVPAPHLFRVSGSLGTTYTRRCWVHLVREVVRIGPAVAVTLRHVALVCPPGGGDRRQQERDARGLRRPRLSNLSAAWRVATHDRGWVRGGSEASVCKARGRRE
jgi:hypothetical protein